MSRVIAVVACGLTVAACSASIPSLNFLSSSPSTAAVQFESQPAGAEVKTSSGQSCHTPCQLTVQVAPEISATFELAGYQPETVAVRSEEGSFLSSPKLTPNPVHVELHAMPAPPAKKMKKRPAVASASKRANAPVASASAAPPPAPASKEAAASATNYPWPDPPSAKQ